MLEVNRLKEAEESNLHSLPRRTKNVMFKMCLWSWITAVFPIKKRNGNEYEY
jgi:hypothetical protein